MEVECRTREATRALLLGGGLVETPPLTGPVADPKAVDSEPNSSLRDLDLFLAIVAVAEVEGWLDLSFGEEEAALFLVPLKWAVALKGTEETEPPAVVFEVEVIPAK